MEKPILDKRKCLLCNSEAKPLFCFPKDSYRFMLWIQIIQRDNLLSCLSKDYIRNNGRLCASHFEDDFFTSTLKSKLTKSAVPYLSPEDLSQKIFPDSVSVDNNSNNSTMLSELKYEAKEEYILPDII